MKPRDLVQCVAKIYLGTEGFSGHAHYNLDNSVPPHQFVDWFSALPRPTEQQLDDAWAQLSKLMVENTNVIVNVHKAVSAVDLLIGEDVCSVQLTDGDGVLPISFADGVLQRVVKFLDQATYGNVEVTVYASQ